jgi:uncharacterized protein
MLDTDRSARPHQFEDVITTHDELRAILGTPGEGAVRKDIGRIDPHGRAYIARSPFALVGTADASGRCDVSPRGDAPGFALVVDEHTLALPERPGNRRGDTLTNVIDNPEIGILFLVPGIEETLRINGRARVVRDAALRERMTAQGRAPALAIVVDVREAYFHCAKAFRRSKLWDPAGHAARDELATLGEVMRDQLCLRDITSEQLDAGLEKDYKANLY